VCAMRAGCRCCCWAVVPSGALHTAAAAAVCVCVQCVQAAAAAAGQWYPPVRSTLLLLSKLYRCIDTRIFAGLAQEAVAACTACVQVRDM
jgi:hypothetical protein